MKLSLRALPFVLKVETLYFASGFSALVLEVLYVRLLRYWTGNTASAIAAVLCAYMGGLAVGSQAAGKWLVARGPLLAIYGGLELVIGLYSLGLPWLLERLEPFYLRMTSQLGPDTHLAFFGHFIASVAMLSLPTVLMGASFPVVVRAGSRAPQDHADAAEKLYFSNLAGAAVGTLLSDFLLIRFWGLGKSLALIAAVNTAVAFGAFALDRQSPPAQPEAEALLQDAPPPRSKCLLIPFLALAGGFLVLIQEIIWAHMVGQFLDNTVYGFAVVLFTIIAGLGLGALLAARRVVNQPAEKLLPWTCIGAGLLVMLLVPFWDNALLLTAKYSSLSIYTAWAVLAAATLIVSPKPKTLAYSFGGIAALGLASFLYLWLDNAGAQFWIHHEVELAVSSLFMLAPAVLMGMVFPLVLEWHLESRDNVRRAVAPVYALNTLGSLGGIVVATFLVVPWMGVERGARAVGLALFALGLLLVAREVKAKSIIGLALVPALAWVLLVPGWDYSKPHAVMGHAGKLVYAQEDLNGGVTTVLESAFEKNLYVNGLIQAGSTYLVRDQARVALVPLLYVHDFGRAMVIGIGSGQTAGIVGLFPFERVDVVDLSPRVAEAAAKHFGGINLGLFNNPRVQLRIADGRHYLLTHPEKLSLLTIEVNRLWVAGEGDLYTREFYELCSRRLEDRGVFQQWLPLFHLSLSDTMIILRSLRQVFPYVSLYMGGESGMLVASRSPLVVDYARLREMDASARLRPVLVVIQLRSISSLMGDCVLLPEGLDALLARTPERRVSTDLWPHLEHSNAHYYREYRSSVPLRSLLLSAQEFRIPPVHDADEATLEAIRQYALEERDRLLGTPPPH